jgi:putative intracellular protease/amidase
MLVGPLRLELRCHVKLAGHEVLETAVPYVHLNELGSDVRLLATREKLEREAEGPHNSPHMTNLKAS